MARITFLALVWIVMTISTSEWTASTVIERFRRQTTSGGVCVLPGPLQHGRYWPSYRRCPPEDQTPACQLLPGAYVPPDWVLHHSCDDGYKSNLDITVAVCIRGRWTPALPVCSRSSFQDSTSSSGKKKYYVETAKQGNWHETLMACLRNGMRLATVDNMEELEQLRTAINLTGIREANFYLSASDAGDEGNFVWVSNGKTLSSSSPMWKNPSNTQPDNHGNNGRNIYDSGEDCVEIWERHAFHGPGYYLNDRPCNLKGNYVCEYYET